ncbi:MAG: hypothetical protein WC461_02155 [Candidatus Paceibacterota bacterium]
MKEALSVLAGLLSIVALVPYIRGILRKETRPAKASWVVWAIVDVVILASMYAKGVVNGQIIGTVVGCLIVTVLALKYGAPGWTKLDKFCLIGAVLGIFIWQMSGEAIHGIVIALTVSAIGSVPTFVSAWEDHRRENKPAWAMVWFGSLCMFGAIPEWTFASAVQPVTFFVLQSVLIYILFVRPRLLRLSAT